MLYPKLNLAITKSNRGNNYGNVTGMKHGKVSVGNYCNYTIMLVLFCSGFVLIIGKNGESLANKSHGVVKQKQWKGGCILFVTNRLLVFV